MKKKKKLQRTAVKEINKYQAKMSVILVETSD